MKTNYYPDREITAIEASARLVKIFKKNLANPVLVMLSGGSCLELLNKINKEEWMSVLNSNVTITTLDERYSDDPEFNNFLQIKQANFYSIAKKMGCNFLETVPFSKESLEKFANRIEQKIFLWKKNNPEGKIITTLGMGADGHTAGISPMPNNKELFKSIFLDQSKWVVGYEGNLKPKKRITVTPDFIKKHIDFGVVFVTGEEKLTAWKSACSKNAEFYEVPAKLFQTMQNVFVYTNIKPLI